MYKNVLQGIDNIAIWPIVSFIIFFVFFIGLLWWVFSRDKKYIEKMGAMPLNETNMKESRTLK